MRSLNGMDAVDAGSRHVLRVVIVDDESLGRQLLRSRLELVPDVEVLGEAEDGPSAIELITRLRPDLVFLDVRMPGQDGLQVLEAVAKIYLPLVIFVTAHDQFATRAFDLAALDYLIKPVAPQRLVAALERARRQLAKDDLAGVHQRVASLLEHRDEALGRGTGPAPEPAGARGAEPPLRRLVVRERGDYILVPVARVEAFEAAGNYVRVALADQRHLVRGTLAELERRLDPAQFVRVHRSTIINSERIARITPEPSGDFTVTLHGGRQYRMSRNFRARLLP